MRLRSSLQPWYTPLHPNEFTHVPLITGWSKFSYLSGWGGGGHSCVMECGVVITRDSESDNVFALCVCMFVCHDVCPDDFTKTDWCLMHNILQLYRISYVSINISTKALIKSSNIDNQLSCWHIQLPVSFLAKNVCRDLTKCGHFENVTISNTALTSNMKRSPQIML